jgi:hypothetical protein
MVDPVNPLRFSPWPWRSRRVERDQQSAHTCQQRAAILPLAVPVEDQEGAKRAECPDDTLRMLV